jgi:histidyl-tRNA synthetase
VRDILDRLGVRYTLQPTLVRGLDYYTRTTFEFVDEAIGAQSSIAGGGRYDGLIEEIGGPPTPGIGFGAGIERLLLSLEAAGLETEQPTIDVFFAVEREEAREQALAIVAELRRRGLSVDLDYAARSLKGQLTQAQRLGAAKTVIVEGEESILRGGQGAGDERVPTGELVARLSG